MNKSRPVLIIEDDLDDQEILREIFNELKYSNELFFFNNAELAFEFLFTSDTIPFLILSDINMPRMDGFQLKKKIVSECRRQVRAVPFLFFSTASGKRSVVEAFDLSIHGYFVKQHSVEELKHTISVIIEYWKRCMLPNDWEY